MQIVSLRRFGVPAFLTDETKGWWKNLYNFQFATMKKYLNCCLLFCFEEYANLTANVYLQRVMVQIKFVTKLKKIVYVHEHVCPVQYYSFSQQLFLTLSCWYTDVQIFLLKDYLPEISSVPSDFLCFFTIKYLQCSIFSIFGNCFLS